MPVQSWVRRVRWVRNCLTLALISGLLLAGLTAPQLHAATVDGGSGAGTNPADKAVQVPEHPEGMSAPNQIKDIKAADPGAKVNLIEPPTANNAGDARLSYPIEVPKGRAGIQPDLKIGYNSVGANGWAGVGWDLATPTITVDTRWGVPRYDSGLESETYLLNGQQLTPVAHRGELKPRSTGGTKVFHTRVEGRFDKIVRHGDTPKDYWWEVTDKAGTRSLYGGGDTAQTTLADAGGNIATWALREVRDLHGNFMRYQHVKVADGGVAGATVQGSNLYPQKITYTGHGAAEGKYSVTFVRDRERGEARRTDVQIDARNGFKKVTADLLRRVEVKLGDDLVRAYQLNYRTGAFAKTLLASVSQYGEDNTLFNTHTFDYFDDVRDASGNYNAFGTAAGWNVADDQLGVDIREGEASALSASSSVSAGGHLYVGYNPGAPLKSGSVGVKVGGNVGTSDGLVTLTDVNGDSLPDKVFRKNGGVFYRPNLSGPGGQPKFGDTALRLTNLPGISRESSLSGTVGIEGYAGVAAQLDFVGTTTMADRYFADVNGDQITDLVNEGGVLFGYLDADGQPAYSANSGITPVPVGSGQVSGKIVGDQSAALNRQVANSPLLDSVRRWVAPYTGTVRVEGGVKLADDSSAGYELADGVRVAIQHKDTELWTQRIVATDHTSHAPAGVDSIAVSKGDAIYFRVQSVFDGMYDEVAWDPKVSYVGVTPSTDANGLANYSYQASQDLTLGGRPSVVTAPLTGTLQLTGDVIKSAATSDAVTVVIMRGSTEVFKKALPATSTGTTAINLAIPVNARDTLSWKLRTDSPIDARAIQWTPKAHYTAASGPEAVVDKDGNPTIVINPPYDLDLYPVSTLNAPLQYYTVPQTGTLTAEPDLQYKTNFDDREVAFTVKKRGGQVIAKRIIGFTRGAGVPPFFTRVSANVTAGDQLYFEFSTLDSKTPSLLNSQIVRTSIGGSAWTQVPSALYAAAPQGAFPQPYRGWGAIGYRGDGARATQPVKQNELVVDESYRDSLPEQPTESDVPGFEANPTVDTPRVAVFAPLPAKGRWAAADENAWVTGSGAGSSRAGVDTIDVVTDDEIAGGKGVPRIGVTAQVSGTLAAGPFGGTALAGVTGGAVDFMDLNGDNFPDVVGSGGIQYSDMLGGLGATRGSLGDAVRAATSVAGNVSFSAGSPARTQGTGLGMDSPNGYDTANTSRTGSEMPALGIGGNLGGGESDARNDLLDINGDGLPDKVYANGDAALNLGYSFAAREPWAGGPVNDAQTRNVGVNLGFNLDSYGFAGGVSATVASSKTNATMLDVTGDGLADRVFTNGANPVQVAVNTGSGFTAKTTFRGSFADIAADRNANVGGGVYFTFGVPIGTGFIVFNPGADASVGIGRAEVALRDVNGDGLADHVKSTSDNQLVVAENKTGRSNLLKSVARPLGARIDLDYQRSGNTYGQPGSRWVMSRSAVSDGHPGDGQDTQLTTYRYEDGKYDRLERDFLGFGKVVAEQRNPGAGDAVYRISTSEYRIDSAYTKGLLKRTTTADGAGKLFDETVHTYQLRDVLTGESADAASTTATAVPLLTRTDKRFYEGAAVAGKSTYVEMSYDEYGNVIRWVDAADEGAADDVEVTLGYTACRDLNLVGTANQVRERGLASGTVLRHRESTVDCATGEVRQVRAYLDGGAAAVTDLTYAADGNLASVTNPANERGQRFTQSYGYDDVVGVHVDSIQDSFGYSSSAAYNLKYGEAERTTDENGQQVRRSYDTVGRVKTVTGPYELDSGKVTMDFEYHPEAAVPYAASRNVARSSNGVLDDTIDTVTFTDGLSRVVQVKKDAAVAATPGATPTQVMTVSGRTKFDFLGRAVEQYHPITEPKGPGNQTFNAAFDAVAPTKESFDVLDRTVTTVLPDGVITKQDYGFGPDRAGTNRFRTVLTDGNGKQRETFTDIRELVTSVKEHNPAGGHPVIWTSYSYDPLGQLVTVTDDQNNVTRTAYDLLGRRTVLDSPDAGRTESRYDAAGNLTAKITANLKAAGQQVTYAYEYNRLTQVDYPTFDKNDVSYEYGAPGADHRAAGRITKVTDAAGTVTRKYGPLGETTEETRTIAVEGASKSYTTKWSFDAFNRVLQLTYPDGEALKYDYDAGGSVNRATGTKGSNSYTYLARLDYDKFGQRVLQETGEGTRTTYSYDAEDRRLATLKSTQANGSSFQNLGYSYDKVGNVTQRTNTPTAGLPIGGASSQTYTYDDRNQLTNATGEYNNVNKYSLAVSYDSIRNTTTKTQVHQVGTGGPADQTTYGYDYTYASGKPHAPSKVGPTSHEYDANGNLIDTVDTARRQYVWDEENRLACNADGATTTVDQAPSSCAEATVRYTYDAKGDRVVKKGEALAIYPNRNYSERDGAGYKHVFIGDNRLVTKTVKPDGVESEQSYFHTDHLGSSGYVTDTNGALAEHFEYFAFGETWVEESAGSADGVPYKFTGKEQDEETGLYYHGARYYNPRTQLWTGADPALPDYYDSDLAGGIHNPANLATYTYTYNNPLKYTDPDGRSPDKTADFEEMARRYPDVAQGFAYIKPDSRISYYNVDMTQHEGDMLGDLYPWKAYDVLAAGASAKALNKAIYGGDGYKDGEPGNAYQHMYWSAKLTQLMGADWAKEYTEGHEGDPGPTNDGNGAEFQLMDQYNNRRGRELGNEYKGKSDRELSDAVERAVANGEGVILTQNKMPGSHMYGIERSKPHR